MKNNGLDYYSEIIISNDYPGNKKGRKGVILGISKENNITYGYSVLLHGEKLNFFLEEKYAIPTGKNYSRNDFY